VILGDAWCIAHEGVKNMNILQITYGKHQLVHVLDHRHKINQPCYIIDIDFLLDGKWVAGIPDCIITPESPHYDVMVRNDFWDIGTLHHLITEHQKAVFDVVMKERLTKLAGWDWLVYENKPTKELWEFVPCEDGGFNIWHNDLEAETRKFYAHCHTLPEALDMLWVVCHEIDDWRAEKGAYLEDIEGVVSVIDEQQKQAHEDLKLFLVPRLARIIDMPALVLVGIAHNGLTKIIGWDWDKWYIKTEHKDGTYAGMDEYESMSHVIDAVWKNYPNIKLEMRQLGPVSYTNLPLPTNSSI